MSSARRENADSGKRSGRRLFFGAAGAALAAAALAPDAEAATNYAPLNANGKIPGVNLPVATATTGGIVTVAMMAKSERVLFTNDFGCTTNDGTDCSVPLQNAINQAAALGATLVVQQGTMTLTQPIWIPGHRMNIRGAGLANVLSWAGATFDGPAIKVGWSPTATETQRGKIPGNPPTIYYDQVENLQLVGPAGANTTVDGWRFGESNQQDTGRWTLDRVEWTGFRHQEIMGNGAFLIHHRNCVYTAAAKTAVVFDGIENCGENLTWTECRFQDVRSAGSTILRMKQPQMLLDAFFTSCSFLYSNRVLISLGGTFQFSACHFESASASSWFALSTYRAELNNKDTGVLARQNILQINGGQLVPSADSEGVAPALARLITIDDAFTDGASTVVKSNRPSTVVLYGAHIAATFPTRVLDTSRVTDARAKTVANTVANATYGTWGDDRWNDSVLSWGPAFSYLRNAGFDAAPVLADIADPGLDQLMTGWCLPSSARSTWGASEDTSTKLFGARSLKFAPSSARTGTMLAQYARAHGGKQLDIAVVERMGSDFSGSYDVLIAEFDGSGREVVPETNVYTATAPEQRNSWRISGYSYVMHVASCYARIRFSGDFSGSLWFDSVEATHPA
ncbi:hypothetical protein HQQ81_11690 [Microbacteriaceae bacterium VKM Ac-2854]|nr:hypothetical protein [Microbacteriaceae bacterium VKM Ac-2854]